jgi:hypothetical protein
MNIEGKVPIAADAAALVIAYLDELNIKLVQAGVKNSYLIVADAESMIIEALKRQGKKTKLGNEEVLRIINDEFDDPDVFVNLYLSDMNPEIQDEKINMLMADPYQRRLIRREKVGYISGSTSENDYMSARFLITTFPVLILTIALLINLTSSSNNRYTGMLEGYTITIISVFIFIMIELITGIRGELIVNVKQSIRIRYTYRGVFLANMLLTLNQYIKLYPGNYYWSFIGFSSTSYLHSYSDILITYIILLVCLELMILIRDHAPKFYPLEPEFRLIVRFLTPPYLLAGAGLFVFLLEPDGRDNIIYGSILVVIGILWATIRNYKVSPRFYISTISFILFATVILNVDIFYVAAYGVGIYIGYIIIESLIIIRSGKGGGLVSKLKEQYEEYYKQ